MPDIVEGEYPLFVAGLPRDRRLPPTYAEWREQFTREDAANRAAGLNTAHIIVRYREVSGFLARIGMKPCYDALGTYARFVMRGRRRADVSAAPRAP